MILLLFFFNKLLFFPLCATQSLLNIYVHIYFSEDFQPRFKGPRPGNEVESVGLYLNLVPRVSLWTLGTRLTVSAKILISAKCKMLILLDIKSISFLARNV